MGTSDRIKARLEAARPAYKIDHASPPTSPSIPLNKALDPPRIGPIERDEKGRVKKGHSLNPSGRPRGATAIARQILERDGSQAWEYLQRIADGYEDVPDALRTEVIFRLQDRAYGKSANINVNADLDPDKAADIVDVQPTEELQAMLRLTPVSQPQLPEKTEEITDAEYIPAP